MSVTARDFSDELKVALEEEQFLLLTLVNGCSATIWMGKQRQSEWPFWRSRRDDDCRGATITQAIFL
jgi:hypothetical protein